MAPAPQVTARLRDRRWRPHGDRALPEEPTLTSTPKTILADLAFPEGPRWRDGRLWFSDMHAHEVVAMAPDGARETIYAAQGPVSGLGWLPDGRLIIVSMADMRLLRMESDGRVEPHADLFGVATGLCNDMVMDAQGRAYVGNFGFDFPGGKLKPAVMARADPDGRVTAAADELMFPNGAVITPEGKTLIVGETLAGRMTAFDVAADGALSGRRLWAQLPPRAVPDGCCLDAEGAIWVASPTTNEVLRLKEGGEVTERIDTGRGAYACMLGGDDRRTLYLLTCVSSNPEECARDRTGRIEQVRVDVPGAGLP
jgi:sugar lactone lactonase YvrE